MLLAEARTPSGYATRMFIDWVLRKYSVTLHTLTLQYDLDNAFPWFFIKNDLTVSGSRVPVNDNIMITQLNGPVHEEAPGSVCFGR